jgi:hypothetical protein
MPQLQASPSEHAPGCSCRSGERCTCSLKKEYLFDSGFDGEMSPSLDTIPEYYEGDASSSSNSPPNDIEERNGGFVVPPKPSLISHKSETALHTLTAHHKRNHDHQNGVHKHHPYGHMRNHHGIHIHNSHHGPTRSVDSIPASLEQALLGQIQELPHPLHESIASAKQEVRISKSANNSPHLRASQSGAAPPTFALDEPLLNWNLDWNNFDLTLPTNNLLGNDLGLSDLTPVTEDALLSATSTDGGSTFATFDAGWGQESPWSPSIEDTNPLAQRSSAGSNFNLVPQIAYTPDEFEGIPLQLTESKPILANQNATMNFNDNSFDNSSLRPYSSLDFLPNLSDGTSSSASSLLLSRVSSAGSHRELGYTQLDNSANIRTEIDDTDPFLKEVRQEGDRLKEDIKSLNPQAASFYNGAFNIYN